MQLVYGVKGGMLLYRVSGKGQNNSSGNVDLAQYHKQIKYYIFCCIMCPYSAARLWWIAIASTNYCLSEGYLLDFCLLRLLCKVFPRTTKN